MPWQNGFVPSDGYRMYIHGTSYKMEFEPCGHKIEDYCEEDISHSNSWAFEQMERIRDRQVINYRKQENRRTFPHERNLLEGVQCPWCDEKTTGVKYSIDRDTSQIPERQFRVNRIMGWA